MPVNLRSLIGKLNETSRKALEAAAGLVPGADALRHRNRALPVESCSTPPTATGAHPAPV